MMLVNYFWCDHVQIEMFDNLTLSAHLEILHLLYKGLTDGPGVESPGFKK